MRFYHWLLRLYPSSFRHEYESELAAVFGDRTRDYSAPRRAVSAMVDIIPNAIAAHRELLVQDLRFSIRSLLRSPGFAMTAILVAALGVGANTAAFSLADFVLVRPLPFHQPDRLVKLWQSVPTGRNELSPSNFRDWKTQSRSFAALGATTWRPANLVGMGDPRRVEMVLATPEVLPLMGVPALLGRHFTAAEARTESPIVLSYALWQSQFGGDRGVIGRGVTLDGVPHTIVGVMPASFHYPRRGVEAWAPLVFSGEDMEDRTNTYIEGIGRLRKGVTFDQAKEELSVIAKRLEQQFPVDNAGTGAFVMRLRDEVSERSKMLVIALCGAALCILLLSCANLANLFLARGAHRARELAVRSALGAGRDRLVRQLITESFVVAFLGGAAGVGLAALTVPLLSRLVPAGLPTSESPSLDLRVLGVAALFMVITGLAFGVLPAMRASGGADLEALRSGVRSGGGRTQRLRATLVIVEIVASVVLLVSAGLLIRAIWNIQSTAPGFKPEHVLTLKTALPMPKYKTVDRRAQFFTHVLDEVRALPGVKAAGYVTGLPMQMRGGIWAVSLGGEEPKRDGTASVGLRFVTPQYFAAMGIPLLRGRDVADTDTAKQQFVTVVSDSFAKRHWPGQDPLGKRFKVAFADRVVVGVVGDVRVRGLEMTSEPQIYMPHGQVEDGSLTFYVPRDMAVRTTVDPETLIEPIRNVVQRVDREQPVSNVRTMMAILEDETASRVTQLRLLGTLAFIALLIAAIGIHGLLTYSVSMRFQELGVRRALGAQVGGIIGLVMSEGIRLAATGVAIGAFAAYIAARGMGSLLVGIQPTDPLTFTTACALCFAAVVVGCLRPAVQAANVDPMTALRAE
ncbi:MAG TPA: ABC transporter permease [Thermoanaerobaculia bacterium]|nr:ABC transporter permease [Thermoanaerobaculia bacterium]